MNAILKQISISFVTTLCILVCYHFIFIDTDSSTLENTNVVPTTSINTDVQWEETPVQEQNNPSESVRQEPIINEIKYEEYPEWYNDDLIRSDDA